MQNAVHGFVVIAREFLRMTKILDVNAELFNLKFSPVRRASICLRRMIRSVMVKESCRLRPSNGFPHHTI
jgi:hypothetical protein